MKKWADWKKDNTLAESYCETLSIIQWENKNNENNENNENIKSKIEKQIDNQSTKSDLKLFATFKKNFSFLDLF